MKAYKFVNRDLTSYRDPSFQYVVGESYSVDPKLLQHNVCGFHACKDAMWSAIYMFPYIKRYGGVLIEVEMSGVIELYEKERVKTPDLNRLAEKVLPFVSSEIKVLRIVPEDETMKLANIGDNNIGIGNIGNRNVGNFNIGDDNIGNGNVGHRNIGNDNTGNDIVKYNHGNWLKVNCCESL